MVQMNAIAMQSIRLYPWHLHVYFPLDLVPLIASIQLHIYIIYALVTIAFAFEWEKKEREKNGIIRQASLWHT